MVLGIIVALGLCFGLVERTTTSQRQHALNYFKSSCTSQRDFKPVSANGAEFLYSCNSIDNTNDTFFISKGKLTIKQIVKNLSSGNGSYFSSSCFVVGKDWAIELTAINYSAFNKYGDSLIAAHNFSSATGGEVMSLGIGQTCGLGASY